ncbi:MAG: phytanoyl-CoA dioxygenase family protein [Aquihabitans sp.]
MGTRSVLQRLGFGRAKDGSGPVAPEAGEAPPVARVPPAKSAPAQATGDGRSAPPVPVDLPTSTGRADIEAVAQLIAESRFVEAVDALAEANRRERHPDLEVALIALRHRAAATTAATAGRSPWPPVYTDPFPDVVGYLPEIPAAELTAELLGGAVAHHGCLIVRGVFSPEQVERSVAAIDRTHEHHTGEGLDEATTASERAWFHPFPTNNYNSNLRAMVARQGGTWMADSPSSTSQILDELADAGVIAAISGHLGERPFFSLQKSTLRRSVPVNNLVAWHQDGSFLDSDVRTMNVWVALSACGGDQPSPGMEVIPRRFEEILPVDGVMSPHSISYDLIAELAATMPTIIPEFAPGDAMVFDEHFVHRTHLFADMTEIRYALECWLFAPSHQSASYTPLLV